MDGWPDYVGWDPSRVRADELRSLAGDLEHAADAAGSAATEVLWSLAPQGWTGSAAEAASELAVLIDSVLGLLAEGLRTASGAVMRYADDIDRIATQAVRAAYAVVEARQRHHRALAGAPVEGVGTLLGTPTMTELELGHAVGYCLDLAAEADAAASRLVGTVAILLDPDAGGWARTLAEVSERVAVGGQAVAATVPVPIVSQAASLTAAAGVITAVVSRSWLAVHDMGRWGDVPTALAASTLPKALGSAPSGQPGQPGQPAAWRQAVTAGSSGTWATVSRTQRAGPAVTHGQRRSLRPPREVPHLGPWSTRQRPRGPCPPRSVESPCWPHGCGRERTGMTRHSHPGEAAGKRPWISTRWAPSPRRSARTAHSPARDSSAR